MRVHRDPIMLLRFALGAGDIRLADLILRLLRGDAVLAGRADVELRALPRSRARRSGLAARTLHATAVALGLDPDRD
jgi:hypothetical protein